MKKFIILLLSFVALILTYNCSKKSSGGESTGSFVNATITGKVVTRTSSSGSLNLMADGSGLSPASNATVTFKSDLNGDGAIGADEQSTATTGSDGKFSAVAKTSEGKALVVSFSLDGYAAVHNTLKISEKSTFTVDGTLVAMEFLTCSNKTCSDRGGSVQISGVDAVSGYARSFNPTVDADLFPGSFSEREGNLLQSAVFAAFDLTGSSGLKLTTLSEEATIRLKIPRDTWPVIRDIETGNSQIDVPMYSFDENLGDWVADGTGWLTDSSGELLAESIVKSLNDGTYSGTVYSVSKASHFSYWNVDWPVASHGCLTGKIVDENGTPAAGAKVSVRGASYTGNSTPQVAGLDGTFCAEVMRSEGANEDVDLNGTNGDSQKVLIGVVYNQKAYRFLDVGTPVEAGSCGDDACKNLGDLTLNSASEIEVKKCDLSGTALLNGAPAPSVSIFADDESLDSEIKTTVCNPMQDSCYAFDTTAAAGTFSLSAAFGEMLRVNATKFDTSGTITMIYRAVRNYTTCPTEAVTINLEMDMCFGAPFEVKFYPATGKIEWEPNVKLSMLFVADATQMTQKWALVSEAGFTGPITYGTVPSGALAMPGVATGTTPLTSTDKISAFPLSGLVPYGDNFCYPTTTSTAY